MWMVLTALLYAFLILSGQSASASGRLAPVNPSVEEHLSPAIQHKQPQVKELLTMTLPFEGDFSGTKQST